MQQRKQQAASRKNISQRVLLKCSLNQIQSRATTHKKEDNQSFRKRKTEKNGSEKTRFTFFVRAAASLSFSRIFPMTLGIVTEEGRA